MMTALGLSSPGLVRSPVESSALRTRIRRRFAGGVGADDVKAPAAMAAARAAGQAVAVCHMGAHALGAAAYTLRAAGLAEPDRPGAIEDEIGCAARPHVDRGPRRTSSPPACRPGLVGPPGAGRLASGQLGEIIHDLQAGLARTGSR